MVEISLSGSGEGPQAETPGAYSTEAGYPKGRRWQGAPLSADRENETTEGGSPRSKVHVGAMKHLPTGSGAARGLTR
jgi:hypothetical protein